MLITDTDQLVENVRTAARIEATASRDLARSIRAAHRGGVSLRRIASAVGRSYEWVRRVIAETTP